MTCGWERGEKAEGNREDRKNIKQKDKNVQVSKEEEVEL